METVDFVALLATLLTIGLFSSGIDTCRKIHISKSVGSSPYLPFVACSLNCALWLLYGCLKPDSTVIFVNAVGLILQILFIVVYHTYTDNKFAVKRDTAIAAAIVFAALLYFTEVASDRDSALFYLGLLCNVFTILFFASPLSTLADVIRKQSTESLSFLLSFMSVLSCATWTVYGFMVGDKFIVLPNAIGLLLSLAQLSLFAIYRNGKKIVSLNNSVI